MLGGKADCSKNTGAYDALDRKRRLQPQLALIRQVRRDVECCNLNYDDSAEWNRLIDKQNVVINQLATLARHLERFIHGDEARN
jgi:hypothetical protein